MNAQPVTICLMPWGRVGSNLVNSVIERGENVTVYNEPLTGIETRCRAAKMRKPEIWKKQKTWLQDHILDADLTGPVFLNLSAVHIANPLAFRRLMAHCDPVYIILDRRDVAATAISTLRIAAWVAEGQRINEKRNWAIPKNASVSFRPEISAAELKKSIKIITLGRKIIDTVTASTDACTYYYEDILMDMDGVILDIFAKARIPYVEYTVGSRKFGSEYLADMVVNVSDVSKFLRDNDVRTDLILPSDEIAPRPTSQN